jgi:3-hydroxyisobutyrate dehydrogenase-like beta-hydroxyacid dehydrogenase
MRHVLFVGLGQMGRALAGNLQAAGFRLVGVDVAPRSRTLAADELGIEVLAGLPGDGLQPTYACVACVPSPADVQSVAAWCLRLPPARRPAALLNLSTIGPDAAESVEALLGDEVTFFECPVTGGVLRTRQRRSTVICGCRGREAYESVLPLLEAMSEAPLHVGTVREASVAKLANNVAAINGALATLEALELGLRAGLSLETLFHVLSRGTADSYVLASTLRRPLLEGDFTTGFAARLAAKDLRLVLDLADRLGLEMPRTERTLADLDDLMDHGLGDFVFPAVALRRGMAEAAAGVARERERA